MSSAPWRVELTRTAQRDLRRLDPPVRTRVEDSLRLLAQDPLRAGALRKLTGAPEWRCGSVTGARSCCSTPKPALSIHVTRVLPRGRAYRD